MPNMTFPRGRRLSGIGGMYPFVMPKGAGDIADKAALI